ncbi:MAG: hypothetical protein ABSE74_05140 [Methanoregula sp.]
MYPVQDLIDNSEPVASVPLGVKKYRADEGLECGVEGLGSLQPDLVFLLAFSPPDVLLEPEFLS